MKKKKGNCCADKDDCQVAFLASLVSAACALALQSICIPFFICHRRFIIKFLIKQS